MIASAMIQFCGDGLKKVEWILEHGESLSDSQFRTLHRYRAELVELAQIARYETSSTVTDRQEMHIETIFLDLDCMVQRMNE